MKTIYSDQHTLHQGRAELNDGQLMPCFENASRVEIISRQIERAQLGEILAPDEFGLDPIARVHSSAYLEFLESVWPQWTELHGDIDALPLIWPVRGFRQIVPNHIDGKISYYAMDAGTPITSGTWQAVRAAANVALTAQDTVAKGAHSAFALCRPPGHHADRDLYGGYCFLNNAAIAAQAFIDQGAKRVAILDVDYHHGNGTQNIFYERDDVMFLSIHADPKHEFPYFLGYADETGRGKGDGFNHNFPLLPDTDYRIWGRALMSTIEKIETFSPDYLIVSLGVDTYAGDPISEFKLTHDDFLDIGSQIAETNLPTVFIMEGGYAVEAIGINVVNVLSGFESG